MLSSVLPSAEGGRPYYVRGEEGAQSLKLLMLNGASVFVNVNRFVGFSGKVMTNLLVNQRQSVIRQPYYSSLSPFPDKNTPPIKSPLPDVSR
jgi:hypothetical protein